MSRLSKKVGFEYFSQDSAEYVPRTKYPGLQNEEWTYIELDFVGDVLDIPNEKKFDVLLCAEVLEHVPDPKRVFQKLFDLASPGGIVVVTVPFLLLMHQAPSFYSSGLSPYWFIENSKKLTFEDISVKVHGDYFDLMMQEINRILSPTDRLGRILLYPIRLVALVGVHFASRWLGDELRFLAGFGTSFVGRKPIDSRQTPL